MGLSGKSYILKVANLVP